MSALQLPPHEVMLTSTRGLRGSPVVPLSAWRGGSDRPDFVAPIGRK